MNHREKQILNQEKSGMKPPKTLQMEKVILKKVWAQSWIQRQDVGGLPSTGQKAGLLIGTAR